MDRDDAPVDSSIGLVSACKDACKSAWLSVLGIAIVWFSVLPLIVKETGGRRQLKCAKFGVNLKCTNVVPYNVVRLRFCHFGRA